VFVSGILPRLDTDQYRVLHLNTESADYVGKMTIGHVQFIDLSREFLRGDSPMHSLYRVSEGFPADKVHLSKEGSDLLFLSFNFVIKEALQELRQRKFTALMVRIIKNGPAIRNHKK